MFQVEMLQSMNKVQKLESVLRVATERFPKSFELWLLRLRFHIAYMNEVSVNQVFLDAVVALGSSSESTLALWKTLILYYQERKERQKVETVFKEGMAQPAAISRPLKPLYLEWVVLTKGIVAGRKLYDSVSSQPPFCLELHIKMASFECFQAEVKLDQVRKCFNTACEQFGKTNTENSEIIWTVGQRWLAHAPPTKVIRVRSPAGSLLDFRMWELCWTMPLAGEFSRGTTVSPALAFQHRSILGSHFMSCSGMTGTYGSLLERPSLRGCRLTLGAPPIRIYFLYLECEMACGVAILCFVSTFLKILHHQSSE
ncbi:hypothetical protein PR048_032701 [Dryococelus australis]|uniref:U3 small nucleolar RNA-associated protein 6 homolog C-terminal domain-containing protein n=1 Tax=Dryococelus australis TaxID=614101 RepID=A0ABQ9G2Z4_9NEOP|nr:hypothetical protein PR048_032701 [Dryococelus australis]